MPHGTNQALKINNSTFLPLETIGLTPGIQVSYSNSSVLTGEKDNVFIEKEKGTITSSSEEKNIT